MTIRLLRLVPVAAALVAACNLLPAREEPAAGAAAPVAVPEAVAPRTADVPTGGDIAGAARPAATRDLGAIVATLEAGRYKEGRTALLVYLQREPDSAMAKSLLEQLDTDPVVLLGKPHRAYVVRRGDTLGALAARHLGDAARFVALARYNGITRPRALRAGQRLKLPTARPVVPPAPPTTKAEVAEGQPQRNEAEPPTGREDAALQDQRRGLALMREGKDEAAYEALGRALAQSPELEPARQQRAALGRALVTGYHEAAVVHFRNQRLDEAIALWDKALALDPGFEPAQGYRTRALELKRRLKALGPS